MSEEDWRDDYRKKQMHDGQAYANLTAMEQKLFDALRPFAHRQYDLKMRNAEVHENALEALEVLLATGALRGASPPAPHQRSGINMLSSSFTHERATPGATVTLELHVIDRKALMSLDAWLREKTGHPLVYKSGGK